MVHAEGCGVRMMVGKRAVYDKNMLGICAQKLYITR
jgi:hypothetical protein